jgi:hypothetical protein
MPFIPDNERVILFDKENRQGNLLTVDDLKQLFDAGCQTTLLTNMKWDEFEPQLGRYNYGYLDERLERMRQSGMRCLLPIWERQNSNFPKDWYARTLRGGISEWEGRPEHLLSPWCAEAQFHALEVMELVKNHCQSDQVQVISSLSRFGESVMPQDARYYDPSARRSWRAAGLPHDTPDENFPGAAEWIRAAYVKMIAAQQAILTRQHNEAWFMFHVPKRGRVNCGVDWFEDYIGATLADNPSAVVNHITFTYFVGSYTGPYANLPQAIDHLRKDVGTIEWCGAEFCSGLRDGNGEKARAIGMRGVVVAPCHAYTKYQHLEPWMVEEIRKAAR